MKEEEREESVRIRVTPEGTKHEPTMQANEQRTTKKYSRIAAEWERERERASEKSGNAPAADIKRKRKGRHGCWGQQLGFFGRGIDIIGLSVSRSLSLALFLSLSITHIQQRHNVCVWRHVARAQLQRTKCPTRVYIASALANFILFVALEFVCAFGSLLLQSLSPLSPFPICNRYFAFFATW